MPEVKPQQTHDKIAAILSELRQRIEREDDDFHYSACLEAHAALWQVLKEARLSTAREILGEIRAKYYAEMPYEHATVGLVHISKADFEQMEARYEEKK